MGKAKVLVTEISAHFDHMCWPRIGSEKGGEAIWACKYGEPTKEQLGIVVMMAEAYRQLVSQPRDARNKICTVLRNVKPAPPSGQKAGGENEG